MIPNALDAKEENKIKNTVEENLSLLKEIGFDVKVVNLKNYFGMPNKLAEDFTEYKSFCVTGGNVFVLRQAMKLSGFDQLIQSISTKQDYLYIGYSAGSCVLAKDLRILDEVDEPICFYEKDDIVYEGLGLIDYAFIPHYKAFYYHKVDLIDKVVQKCQNENIKYKAVKDGEVIIEKI